VRSLRGRLTLGVLLVLAVVLTGAGLATSRSVEQAELDAVDDRLQRTAELSRATAVAAVAEALPDADDRLDAVLDATRTSLRLTLAGRPLLDTGAPPRSRPRLRPGLQTFTASDGQRYRAYVTTLQDAGLGGLVRLEVTSSLASTESRQRRFDRRLLLSGVITLLVTGVGVWLGAAVVLRPLRRLRLVASQVASDEDLARRVREDDGPAEVRSVAASLNAMLARLQRSAADRERALAATRRFAADAGHELRTPLTAVQATLSALRRHPDLDAERRVAMAGDALAEQRRLVDLLDGLQALARGDARPGEVGDVDLVELVDAVVGVVGARHPAASLTCSLPDGAVVVRGWEPGLRVLVENLVENAVRHGAGEDGTVRVALAPSPPTLTVEDDGPGVPAEERERIFAPFARLGDEERPGSGLGLALVAQQAGHHGAAVEVGDADPALGGARFTVRFPAS